MIAIAGRAKCRRYLNLQQHCFPLPPLDWKTLLMKRIRKLVRTATCGLVCAISNSPRWFWRHAQDTVILTPNNYDIIFVLPYVTIFTQWFDPIFKNVILQPLTIQLTILTYFRDLKCNVLPTAEAGIWSRRNRGPELSKRGGVQRWRWGARLPPSPLFWRLRVSPVPPLGVNTLTLSKKRKFKNFRGGGGGGEQ